MSSDGTLQTYTIYERPADNPRGYSMTQWSVTAGGPVWMATLYADSLEQARALVPPGLACLTRDPADDPVIVETWL